MKGCSGTTIKTNGQHRGKYRETKRDETEEEERERVCKVKVSNNGVCCWQMHLASAVEEWGSSMSPSAGLKRCPLQHTAHKNLHEVSLLTGGSGSQTVSTLLLHCEMQQTCSEPTLKKRSLCIFGNRCFSDWKKEQQQNFSKVQYSTLSKNAFFWREVGVGRSMQNQLFELSLVHAYLRNPWLSCGGDVELPKCLMESSSLELSLQPNPPTNPTHTPLRGTPSEALLGKWAEVGVSEVIGGA